EVLEIGPGRGALTRHLEGSVGRLILVELDERLAADLQERFGDRKDVLVVHGDILEVDRSRLVRSPDRLVVVGNIPYGITTPILFDLLERPRPARAVLMVQREVADRILAEPGTAEYGALAVGVRSVARAELVLHVPRTAFRPRPRVDSTVIRIVPLRPPPLGPEEEMRLRALTRLAFQWRRKQMQKILRDHPDAGLPREEVEAVGRLGGWDLTRRPETFSPAELVRMAAILAARGWPRGLQDRFAPDPGSP
ncbi:MAG TPA: 16S rRNA (adenine(1518)-N(6)/adenine(1519)-N(6))-dimethyltransferase RsmA, partial [Longimicrobiales bacterium]|nr:16S rRNA (adenine(1518)-N(6)/adenine(1519)-N(6))-dimethyltransferase RsmA [Longimicrobiales bacterium]